MIPKIERTGSMEGPDGRGGWSNRGRGRWGKNGINDILRQGWRVWIRFRNPLSTGVDTFHWDTLNSSEH
jgi:hypothetical protein